MNYAWMVNTMSRMAVLGVLSALFGGATFVQQKWHGTRWHKSGFLYRTRAEAVGHERKLLDEWNLEEKVIDTKIVKQGGNYVVWWRFTGLD